MLHGGDDDDDDDDHHHNPASIFDTIHYDVGPNLGTTAYVTTSRERNYYYIITILLIIIICQLDPVAVLSKA
jgi:hypothetical protein